MPKSQNEQWLVNQVEGLQQMLEDMLVRVAGIERAANESKSGHRSGRHLTKPINKRYWRREAGREQVQAEEEIVNAVALMRRAGGSFGAQATRIDIFAAKP